MTTQKKVLFVCIENSCRSQMAEGFGKKWGGESWFVASSGSCPSGKVNPKAIASMKEIGIDLSAHQSKGLDQFAKVKWDYVVTMGCGDACPFVASIKKIDWQIPDPKHMTAQDFAKVRDTIEQKVKELMEIK